MNEFAKDRSYPGKLLLFGEYTLMNNSDALCFPVNEYTGTFVKFNKNRHDADMREQSVQAITSFIDYLKRKYVKSKYPFIINFDQFEKHFKKGLFFQSSIKTGYGLGSSGALVAAFYDTYCKNLHTDQQTGDELPLERLISHLRLLESWFHGSGSGLDPLCSYLNAPLLVEHGSRIRKTRIKMFNAPVTVFLVDSNQKRKTAPLVATYKLKIASEAFEKFICREYLPLNNACIKGFIRGNAHDFITAVATLSAQQLNHFLFAIPENILDLWKSGITNNAFYMKLCGAGGGGYFLGFTTNIVKTQELVKHHHMNIIIPKLNI